MNNLTDSQALTQSLMNDLQNNINMSSVNSDNSKIPPEFSKTLNDVANTLEELKGQQTIFCDKECQENQKIENAYNKYLNAKEVFNSAPKNLETAEDEYYLLRDGTSVYMSNKENEYKNEASKLGKLIKNKVNIMINNLKPFINNIELQKKYIKNTKQLSTQIFDKLKSLKIKETTEVNNKNIANRKTIYYNQLSDFYITISNFLYYLITILIIGYIIIVLLGGVILKRPYWIYIILFSLYYILPWNRLYLWFIQKIYNLTSFFR